MYSLPFGNIFFRVCAYICQVYLGGCKNENFSIEFYILYFLLQKIWKNAFYILFYFMFTLHTFIQVEFQYPVKAKEEVFLILTGI